MTLNDQTVLKALEYHKVLDLLATKTATSLGKEAVLALLPEIRCSEVVSMLLETDEAFKIINTGASAPFGGISNVIAELNRAKFGAVLDYHEIMAIGRVLYASRSMKEYFSHIRESSPLLSEHTLLLTVLRPLEDYIENTISADGVVDSASPELMKIRKDIRTYQNKVKSKLEEILRSSQYQKYFQEQLVTIRNNRYVIPVKKEYEQFFPGIVHDESGSGATVFIEPLSVVELNNNVKKFMTAEKEEIERILRKLSKDIAKSADDILANLDVLTKIDVIFAKARLAQSQNATKPFLNENGYINIIKGRHPLIAADEVRPIDVNVGGDIKTLIITGSNAGGKTVTLKIIGLFAMMTQTGLFLPAQIDSQMCVFKAIYADIGDEQSIEQSLSTFSGQIKNMVKIIAGAKKDSLVLLDEICAGTDPKEGSSLAMSILETLQQNGATTVLTTHYSELKVFAFNTKGMENASVEFDNVSLEPTYRLIMGLPGSSNAFHIAERLGLNKAVVQRANDFLDIEHKKLEEVLQNLEIERKEFAKKNRDLENMRQEVAILKTQIAKTEAEIKDKKQEIIEKSRAEASEIVRSARVQAEEAIKEIKNLHNETDSKARQQNIDKARKKLVMPDMPEGDYEGDVLSPQNVQLGKIVFVSTFNQKGTIIAISGDEVTLQIGILKMNVAMEKCFLTSDRKKEEVPKTGRKRAKRELAKITDFKSEIDVRGQNVEEAIMEIDKFIDDALMANAPQVRIIHGKGTGALRKGLEKYFATHKSVRSFTLASLSEGGSGATVLFL